ncbi:MAG: energy-coupling factor transporter transmembrane component T family protein [Anaerolineae bacterium]
MNGFDLYVPGDSWLHRADPRLKLLLVCLGIVVLFSLNQVLLLLLLLAGIIVALRSAAVGWPQLGRVWSLVLPVAILIPILWPVFYRAGPTVLILGPVHVTAWAVAQGFATAARIVALAFLTAAVLLTTEMRALLRSLVRLGLPFEAALTVTIGLSFIPRIQHTYEQVTEAQMARGLLLGAGGFLGRARARVPVLVAALVSTFRGADTLARALECRGFGRQDVRRTSLFEVEWRPVDSLMAFAGAALTLLALLLRFGTGFGSHPWLWR